MVRPPGSATILIEDHRMVAESVARTLGVTYVIGGVLFDGAAVLPWLAKRSIELILLDINLPSRNGLEVLTDIRRLRASPKVLCYSMERGGIWNERVRMLGGDGFICKDESTEILRLAIDTIIHGGEWFPNVHATKPVQSRLDPNVSLSARRIQICQAVANGLTTKAIAGALGISSETVAEHLDETRIVLGAANRADMVRRAIAHGFISAIDHPVVGRRNGPTMRGASQRP